MGNPKIDDEYRVSIKKPGEPSAHQLTARVSRVGEDGCGLSFDGLRQHECLFLSEPRPVLTRHPNRVPG
ncbi:MAG: hypothetical protein KZQ97_19850 [Candidatus Thiodiazotropha sp. (ex Dulcina madagascariensis)]|nr:hypothetical protein [Candidatus Thiodiazotropha sp. (ex Dulcina madagascariensis)]